MLKIYVMIFLYSKSKGHWSTCSTFLACSQLTTNTHWPCHCTVHVYVVNIVITWGHLEWKRFCSVLWSFVYICIAFGDPIIKKGESWDPIYRLTLPHFLACPKPALGFSTSYIVVIFVFNNLRWVMTVGFVDIGGIVDHQSLFNFYRQK